MSKRKSCVDLGYLFIRSHYKNQMKITHFLLFIFAFLGCKNHTFEISESDKISLKTEIKDCKCYSGLEEKPIQIFTFSDNNSISICGYNEHDEYSEFGIFDCKSEKLISSYDAIQTCKLNFEKDTLYIFEYNKLPTNDNWEWNDIKVAEEIITIQNGNIISLGSKPVKIKIEISEKAQTDFLDVLETENYKRLDIEEILARLEVLSISGNERAKKKLYAIENDKNYKLDGAYYEQYKNAIASIEWRSKYQ